MCVLMDLADAAMARAQDSPRLGLTMGYPSAVGVLWHVTDGLALRPEVSVSRSTGDTTTAGLVSVPASSSSADSWLTSVGASGLIYLGRDDALRTYVSPRVSYSRSTGHSSTSSSAIDTTSTATTLSGSFGVEYALARRLGLFGEVGLAYTRTSAATSSAPASTVPILGGSGELTTRGTTHGVNTRSGVGVIFYF